MRRHVTSRGFTLIELIVVIGIVAVISSFLVAVLDPLGQFQKANDARRKSDLAQIQRGLEQYYQDNGSYPESIVPGGGITCTNSIYYQVRGDNGDSNSCIEWGSSWQPYMNVLPQDPGTKRYAYFVSSNRQSYWLYASLERDGDSHMCNAGNECASISANGMSANACNGPCNYGVSSPNTAP